MAGAILSYWHDRKLAQEHGAAGRARAKELFSLDAMVAAYERLFAKLLTLRSGPSSLGAA
jgi:glycosyltransferase involved in cell wall biosynthesis